MAANTSLKAPLALAGIWLFTATLSGCAAAALWLAVPYWHELRAYIAQLGLWQAWVSIAACVGLLALSRSKHGDAEAPWAQGALLIYAMGGLLTALVLNYGVLPNWLAQPGSWRNRSVLLGLLFAHWSCAYMVLRSLWQYRKQTV